MIRKMIVVSALLTGACASEPPAVSCPTEEHTDKTETDAQDELGPTTTKVTSPQEILARLHGCRKLRYQAVGALLTDRGVDLTDLSGTPDSAGRLYQEGAAAFDLPEVDSRERETDGHTTSSAMKLFDIFVQAAPQIIANIDNPELAPACVVDGETHPMFDPVDGSCLEPSVSCLLGQPATPSHLDLCNHILAKADPEDPIDLAKKQYIAVASLMSAAHTCE